MLWAAGIALLFVGNIDWGLMGTILIGSLAADGFLYLWVGDVVVCYRCNAHYRDLTPSAQHKPFELGIAERYRQERLRQEQIQAAKKQ